MRTPSKVTTILATFLFVSPATAREFTDPDTVLDLIHERADLLGPDGAKTAQAQVAYEYGRHPDTASARMTACLDAVEAARITTQLPAPRTAVSR
ncbi:hypothetical protein AB0G85_33210 [Streptomyces sioyaensis]|uniref:hypothetical protein n=1 Tax=Streptomyces sioyaensis TaxID=67364 RepID=UPI0034074E99